MYSLGACFKADKLYSEPRYEAFQETVCRKTNKKVFTYNGTQIHKAESSISYQEIEWLLLKN